MQVHGHHDRRKRQRTTCDARKKTELLSNAVREANRLVRIKRWMADGRPCVNQLTSNAEWARLAES